jgi:hypothetical protein
VSLIFGYNNLKRSSMGFILGFAIGGFVMWIGFKQNLIQWKKDLEKLKDFDTWKEWKNS